MYRIKSTCPGLFSSQTDWMIGNNLGDNAFNIVTRRSGFDCPLGIQVIKSPKINHLYFNSVIVIINLSDTI